MRRLMQLRFAAAALFAVAAVSLSAPYALAFTQETVRPDANGNYTFTDQTIRPRIPTKAPVRSARMARQFSSAFNKGR